MSGRPLPEVFVPCTARKYYAKNSGVPSLFTEAYLFLATTVINNWLPASTNGAVAVGQFHAGSIRTLCPASLGQAKCQDQSIPHISDVYVFTILGRRYSLRCFENSDVVYTGVVA